ncbi:max dimerization protein 4-like [Brienomyrus brachyistius]|uniref:max dimerization protein 4-like n=1 Tax=Brienomyrus brachyistius TaxID=42636 RepID=UPI0020B30220|nr:max dimerization protein 4-like [Brienomyrus brachyistius]
MPAGYWLKSRACQRSSCSSLVSEAVCLELEAVQLTWTWLEVPQIQHGEPHNTGNRAVRLPFRTDRYKFGIRYSHRQLVTQRNPRMELNSLSILLEAAQYLERRDREAEHGYASVLPYDSGFPGKKAKDSPLSRKTQSTRSSHNELEKHRRAKLRLYLEELKQLVPLGPESSRHTTLSLLKKARVHIKKLEEQDRKAVNVKEALQREHRYLKRRLEQLSVSGLERVRTDSMGSTISTDSEQEVDIEGLEFAPAELDSVGSVSDGDDRYGSQDGSYTHPHRLQHCL